jgi:diketogulonate reductase-like aldo/keto reductase
MLNIPVIKANGASIPQVGFGTMRQKGDAGAEIVKDAITAGYRHIDTAANYGNEEDVGRGIKASGIARGDLFVVTKVWTTNLNEGVLQKSAEESLKKLGLDYVDLLLIHWPNPSVPIKESITALCDTKKRGLTRHIGISNHTIAMVEEAVKVTSEPIVCNQYEYHPHLDQSKIMATTKKHGLAFVAYCPIGRGDVGGVMAEAAIQEIAKAKGRTPAQVAIRWNIQQGNVVIPGSSKKERLVENASVFDFSLSDAEMKSISSLVKPSGGRVVNPPHAPKWD